MLDLRYPGLVAAYLPPGWPAGVHPPGSDEFEPTAVTWLLDVVPPDYRLHGVLRRHPVALATLARHHLAACVQGAREGYRTARAELGDQLPPGGMEAVLAAYRSEGGRLVETARAVDLVERALRGEAFTPQLSGTQDEGRSAVRRRGTGRPAGERETPRRSGAASPGARNEERATREGGVTGRPGGERETPRRSGDARDGRNGARAQPEGAPSQRETRAQPGAARSRRVAAQGQRAEGQRPA
jgi:hypothetical protein